MDHFSRMHGFIYSVRIVKLQPEPKNGAHYYKYNPLIFNFHRSKYLSNDDRSRD
jgi:hypothetical protein